MTMIRAYANRTGTKRNLDALRAAGWGLLVCASKSPGSDHRTEGFEDYMLDNAAYKCRNKGETPQERLDYWSDHYLGPFEDLVASHGERARFVVAPDIVCGGPLSLDTSSRWVEWLLAEVPGKILIPAQDGMAAHELAPLLGPRVGLAIGGSTQWKWDGLAAWCHLARERGACCHVLRANSARMVAWASACGATSFDGSGPSKFAVKVAVVDAGRKPTTRVLPGLDIGAPFTPREGKFR